MLVFVLKSCSPSQCVRSVGYCCPTMTDQLDVVVLGATGFTGKLACEYLASYGDKAGLALNQPRVFEEGSSSLNP